MYKCLSFDARCLPIDTIASKIAAIKKDGVTSLSLRGNNLGRLIGEKLARAFAKISVNVTRLVLDYDELKAMTDEQRQAIQHRFPTAKNLILIDSRWQEMNASQTVAMANSYTALGFKADAPSLLNQCSLFIAKKVDAGECKKVLTEALPAEKDLTNLFESLDIRHPETGERLGPYDEGGGNTTRHSLAAFILKGLSSVGDKLVALFLWLHLICGGQEANRDIEMADMPAPTK